MRTRLFVSVGRAVIIRVRITLEKWWVSLVLSYEIERSAGVVL